MTCPMCQDTGSISVREISHDKKLHEDTVKPCPMGCKPPAEPSGVAGGMSLSGNEMTIEQSERYATDPAHTRSKIGRVSLKRKAYSTPGEKLDWRKHYLEP